MHCLGISIFYLGLPFAPPRLTNLMQAAAAWHCLSIYSLLVTQIFLESNGRGLFFLFMCFSHLTAQATDHILFPKRVLHTFWVSNFILSHIPTKREKVGVFNLGFPNMIFYLPRHRIISNWLSPATCGRHGMAGGMLHSPTGNVIRRDDFLLLKWAVVSFDFQHGMLCSFSYLLALLGRGYKKTLYVYDWLIPD